MEKKLEKKLSQFERNDGFNPGVDFSNPIQEKWIHKQVVIHTGDGEDDFILEEKAVKVDEFNIQKRIDEEAKTTDLKYLLKQLLMTGDESVLNRREGFYGDVSMFDEGFSLNKKHLDLNVIKDKLPEEFRKLPDEELVKLSNDEIIAYFDKLRLEAEKKVQPKEPDQKEGEE